MFHPQGKGPVWLKRETSILTVRRQAPARQQGEITLPFRASQLLRSLGISGRTPIPWFALTPMSTTTDPRMPPQFPRSELRPLCRRRAEGLTTPGGASTTGFPGDGVSWARCGRTQRAGQRELRGTAEQRGAGDPPSRPREHPASHVSTVHGQDGGGRAQEGAGSRLRAPPCVRWPSGSLG